MQKIHFIETNPTELKEDILNGLKKELKTLKEELNLNKSKELLTRNEVSKLLKIDLSTLHNWTKKGKLKSYGIGGRVYYKLEDIENSLTQL